MTVPRDDTALGQAARAARADRSRRGLTALELVSALALCVVIFGTLLIALNAATDTWTRATDKNRDLLKVRNALDQLATDLACAAAPRRTADRDADASPTLGASLKPLFIAKRNDSQVGLYFVKTHPTTARSNLSPLSLDLVAYSWTTNGLSRYVCAAAAESSRVDAPDLCEQLAAFKTKVESISYPSNVLSSAIVAFAPLLYQPAKMTPSSTPSATASIGDDTQTQSVHDNVRLADLPDYVDLLVAYANADDWAHGCSRTNYLTRRVTLPAAQASRLP